MPRRIAIAAAMLVLAALLFVGTASAAAAKPAGRIVVVLTPYMTWSDVLTGPMPQLRAVAEKGVVGDMNVRSGAVGAGAPTISRGALMLSAGASALAVSSAFEAYDATESVGSFAARDVYERLFGRSSGDAAVLYLGTAEQSAANLQTTLGNRIGALGDAMEAGGFRTGAVGNSDPGFNATPVQRSRPAAIVAADAAGIVPVGEVSASLLVTDVAAPYGVRTDRLRLMAAYRSAVDADGRFIVVDPGDLTRAYVMASAATTSAAETARREALRDADQVIGAIARELSSSDLLVVLAPVVPEVVDEPPVFAPLVLSGAGMSGSGIVKTASTQRDGVCTIMDVSATLCAAAGVPRPAEMVGSVIEGTGGGSLDDRVASLMRMNDTAVAIESIRTTAANTYITLTIVILFASAIAASSGGRRLPGWVRKVLRSLLLLSLSFAPAGLLMFALVRWPSTPVAAALWLMATALAVWALALVAGRGRSIGTSLMVLSGLTTLVLLADQWLGAPLSFTGVFGYSPLFGARYYGIGNEMAGMLMGSAMVSVALVLDLYRDRPWAGALRRYGWPTMAVIVTATTAAPFLGANVGAIAWMTAGFFAGWLLLNGHRLLSWRNVAIAAAIVVVLLVAASAADLLGSGGGTHLSRAISGVEQSGPAALWTIVARKAETNMRVLGRTNWTWLLVAVLALLGYMRWRPKGEFADMLKRYPAVSAAMAASLVGGLVGYFTEDSGILIPALAMLPVGVAALHLMMSRADSSGGEGE